MDRVSQAQQCLQRLTEMFYTSMGVMQRDAPLVQVQPDIPITAWTAEQLEKNETDLKNLSKEISRDIVETVKVLDFLIDHLPGITETEQEQMERLGQLELENEALEKELDEQVAKTGK